MRYAEAADKLRELKREAREVMAARADPEHANARLLGWREKSKAALQQFRGEEHASKFHDQTQLTVASNAPSRVMNDAVQQAVWRGIATLDAAIYALEELGPGITEHPEAIEPQLWAYVRADVEAEQWPKAAASTATFLEDKIRNLAGLQPEDHGKNLMVKIFDPQSGAYPCGNTSGEQEGWKQLAIGFVQATSNVNRHRIQKRDDARTYAMGVLGTASLILTQLRYEHGSRFPSEP